MLIKLKNHLSEKFSFLKDKKLLLATSGGLDSMVLLDLFQKLNTKIHIAHCNFQLRGIESFEDQKFVQDYAEKNKIPYFTTTFDTENFAKDYQLSIQIAARTLRYDWFYELLESEKLDYILTAHHADDSLETFIINLSRGTGLDGLIGIPSENDKIVRPLLLFSRNEMEQYAQENKVSWREDSSNASDKYIRNKIRHHIVPLLKDLNPNFLESFKKTQTYLQDSQVMVEDATIMIYQQVAKEIEDTVHFDIKKLKQLANYKSYLYQFLKEYGFFAWEDIYKLVDAPTGKLVLSDEYRLIKNRDFLILSPKKNADDETFLIEKNQKEVNFPLNMLFTIENTISETDSGSIFVDQDLLQYPLTLRKWQENDVFYPFGMVGKKKLSKFFKDEKMSMIDKENCWLLCSQNDIVWVVNKRLDNRFKVTKNTKTILKIALSK